MALLLEIQKTNVGIKISSLKVLCVCQFSGKTDIFFTFLVQICPKINFGVGILKISVLIENHHLQDTICINFQLKRTILNCLV